MQNNTEEVSEARHESASVAGASDAPAQRCEGLARANEYQELGGTGQAPNRQELGGTGQAPNRQKTRPWHAEQPPRALESALCYALSPYDHVLKTLARGYFLLPMLKQAQRFARPDYRERLQAYLDASEQQLFGEQSGTPAFPAPTGRRQVFRYPTPYRPFDRGFASEFETYARCQELRVHAWRHPGGAPASLLLLHSWGTGDLLSHRREFGVPYFFRDLGLDVYFYVLPYHAVRKPKGSAFSGELFPGPDLLRTNEGMRQSVLELRGLITRIKEHNPAPLGLMGSSLGGYLSALLASLDERIDFAVAVQTPSCLARFLWNHAGPLTAAIERRGLRLEDLQTMWRPHSPLARKALVPRDFRMMVNTYADSFVPSCLSEDLYAHWEQPQLVRFIGAHHHLSQLGRHRYHRAVGSMLSRLLQRS